jgi:hypothetical protein
MNMMRMTVLVFASLALGCGSKSDDAQARLDGFKAFIEKTHTSDPVNDGMGKLSCKWTIDLIKTDKVGEPYLGLVKVEVAYAPETQNVPSLTPATLRLHYEHAGDTWTCNDKLSTMEGPGTALPGPSGPLQACETFETNCATDAEFRRTIRTKR